MAPAGKGARRLADVSPELLQALSRGETQSRTLTEQLALDQEVLVRTVFPALPAGVMRAVRDTADLGILKRMAGIGTVLWDALGEDGLQQACQHPSDTVRGWACFMVGAKPGLDMPARLAAIRPLADDAHFGVREWAWMAVRPHLVQDLKTALRLLQAWTTDESERVRRFASEVLRPRGVWCTHIAAFRQQPQPALPLLSALRADPAPYVQDSVANWLNDAAKDHPDWVRQVCADWLQGDPPPATHRICQRAMRSLKPAGGVDERSSLA